MLRAGARKSTARIWVSLYFLKGERPMLRKIRLKLQTAIRLAVPVCVANSGKGNVERHWGPEEAWPAATMYKRYDISKSVE